MNGDGARARAYLICLALVLSSASPSRGFFSQKNKITVLWIPSENFKDWSRLDDILEHYKDLKFTIAVAPEDVPPDAAKKLAAWSTAGRLELALRLKGDPVLPSIVEDKDAPRPQDVVDRLALSRDAFKSAFGFPPTGFSPGGGAVSPSMLPAFGAMGLSWVACGPYAPSSAEWSAAGTTLLAALSPVKARADLKPEDVSLPGYPYPAVFAVDEADGLAPEGSWLELLRRFSDKHPDRDWATISEAAAERRKSALVPAAQIPSFPAWVEGAQTAGARKAWQLYIETARALAAYQNSGSADISNLDEAAAELYAAQAGRYYRAPSGAADRELRAHLAAVYRKMKQTPPEILSQPISGEPETEAGVSTDVHFAAGKDWISFENPPGSPGRKPEAARQEWSLHGLRVEWTEQDCTFAFKLARVDRGEDAPQPLDAISLEAYVDLNHVAGAGSVALIPGHPGAVAAGDAWEYAIAVSSAGAALFRSNPTGPPKRTERLAASFDAPSGDVRVVVPRSLVKGNPGRWGYVAIASDPSTGTVAEVIAPLEQQRAAMSQPTRPRYKALRARSEL